ncbi:MAG: hypothetical protein KKC75_01360 [Nanoarchaeota archaeon]|nr:hypothetical protein [Nanoarchaeota archaeon]MBU1004399.1 hypothetical protein [Nanoarchaeota archaeon]MBU1946714.1 hypothetical protein [Nanoarchaeota archaeon]
MIEYEDLIRKGYSPREAQRTMAIMQSAEQNKPTWVRFFDSITYWALLIVAIIGNLIISIILFPFLLAFKRAPLYITIVILAALFGFLFDQLIRELEHINNTHHIIAWIFIPALAIINTYYMTTFANYITSELALPLAINSPLVISIVYVFAFISPYIIHNVIEISRQ